VGGLSGLETPASAGYRMPAEWERHEATWMAWPHETSDWPGKFAPIPWVYASIVGHIARGEKVRILVQDAGQEQRARGVLRKAGVGMENVEFFPHPTDRCWTRDYGPLFVRNEAGTVAATKWIFNGWAKYANHANDDAAGAWVAERLGVKTYVTGVVLEGGSVDVNGAGALLTTEECLLSPVQARNPGLGREELEGKLKEYLGAERVIWLGRGIAGDDTHGHVDDIARFVDANTIVAAVEDDPKEVNYEPLRENLELLRATGFGVVTLPMPKPVFFDGQRLPASYANFYIANAAVLVPVFNDANDRVALDTLAGLFPDREVVGIYCGDLVLGLGTLHCMTQQQPASH
jgi:agmatine deiminase